MGARDALDGVEVLLGQLKQQLDEIPVHIQFVGLAVFLIFAQTIVSLLAISHPSLPFGEKQPACFRSLRL